MKSEKLTITLQEARRLFLLKQRLVGKGLKKNLPESITEIVRDIAFIQWDPVTVVAPSHMISLWSRLGKFDWNELDELMFESKQVFLHYSPIAFLVLVEDYSIYNSLMKNYPHSLGKSWNSHISAAKKFLESRENLSQQILQRLRDGPKSIGDFYDIGERKKSIDGWTSGNEVSKMLYQLHMLGKAMISGRVGNQNLWSLTENFLPAWVSKDTYSEAELESITAMRSFNALGVATEFDINRYFVRGRYWKLREVLDHMEKQGNILRVEIEGKQKGKQYFISANDLKLIDKLDSLKWETNMKLIAPFDNILNVRDRAERLFNFKYTLEQFFPQNKRKFGTYVLPILWQDQLVGRIDAKLEKKDRNLKVISVHVEDGFENNFDIPENLADTLIDFSGFISADKITYGNLMPEGWNRYLSN